MILHVFRVREDDLDRSYPCKKLGCLSVCEHNSRKQASISKKFEHILKYLYCLNTIEIGERRILVFIQEHSKEFFYFTI